MAPRKNAKAKAPDNVIAAELLKAMSFLGVIPHTALDPAKVLINGRFITATNGIMRAGIMVADNFPSDIIAKLDMSQLQGALSRVDKDLTIAFTQDEAVFEGGKDFSARLINHEPDVNDAPRPDPSLGPLTNDFRTAVGNVAMLAKDNAETVDASCIAVTGQTVQAENRHTVLESFHGNNMPPVGYIFLPKQFAQALAKVKTDLVGWGMNGNREPGTVTSFTVYFADNTFLQTNTFADAWSEQIAGFASGLMEDKEPDEPIVDADPRFATDLQSIMQIAPGDDVLVKLGELRAVPNVKKDGSTASSGADVRIEAKYLAPATEFVMSPSWFTEVARYVGRYKTLTNVDPMRLIFWSANGEVRGAMGIDLPPPPPQPTQAPAPAWGQAPPAAPAWGAAPAATPTQQPAWGATPPSRQPATPNGNAFAAAPPQASPAASMPPVSTASPSSGAAWTPPPFPPSSGQAPAKLAAQAGWGAPADDND